VGRPNAYSVPTGGRRARLKKQRNIRIKAGDQLTGEGAMLNSSVLIYPAGN
jgi:hypothetical protein|tara:strand:+ start:17 stop:169 length:153 start_codon:yes stop_codon:yes gene_type:complete